LVAVGRSRRLFTDRTRTLPLAVIVCGLLGVSLLRYRVTINDHAAARDSHRRTIAAISPKSAYEGAFALRAYQPLAWRVYPPAADP
jgi:hypothetical protein